MIELTRINHVPLIVNSDLIEYVETAPDTILTLTNGQKLVVLENAREVVRRVIEFRHSVMTGVQIHDDGQAGLQPAVHNGNGKQ